MKDISSLCKNPPDGIRMCEEDENDNGTGEGVECWIRGPDGTPYHDGYFKVRFEFSPQYPAAPPRGYFVTRIFHPNVAPKTGEICVSTLKRDWKPELGLVDILVTIKCLLIYPNAESALFEEAGRLLLDAYDDYASRARSWTRIHGNFASTPMEFKDSPDPLPSAESSSILGKSSWPTDPFSQHLPPVSTVLPGMTSNPSKLTYSEVPEQHTMPLSEELQNIPTLPTSFSVSSFSSDTDLGPVVSAIAAKRTELEHKKQKEGRPQAEAPARTTTIATKNMKVRGGTRIVLVQSWAEPGGKKRSGIKRL